MSAVAERGPLDTDEDVCAEQIPGEMTIHTGSYCGDVTDTNGYPTGLWVMLAVDDSTPYYRTGRSRRVDFTCAVGAEAMTAAIAALTTARNCLKQLPADVPAPEVVGSVSS